MKEKLIEKQLLTVDYQIDTITSCSQYFFERCQRDKLRNHSHWLNSGYNSIIYLKLAELQEKLQLICSKLLKITLNCMTIWYCHIFTIHSFKIFMSNPNKSNAGAFNFKNLSFSILDLFPKILRKSQAVKNCVFLSLSKKTTFLFHEHQNTWGNSFLNASCYLKI